MEKRETEMKCSFFLVVDTFFFGWHAQVTEEEIEIIKEANIMLVVVKLIA